MSLRRIRESVLDFNEEEAILYRYFTYIYFFLGGGGGLGGVFFNLEYVTSELPHCRLPPLLDTDCNMQ